MSDPTTLHQPGLDARVLVKIGLAIIACLAAVLGVAVAAIFGQIGNARVEVGSVWTGLSAINDRLGRIEKTVDETRATLDRLPRAEFIREFLKIPPKNATATAKIALWIRVPAQATKPLPDGVVGKLEKLKGLRYAVDANNAIALIEPSTNIVIALI